MKKKGFTLIELLAVIIILAIIALIATPVVLNVIDNAREKSRDIAASNIFESAGLFYKEQLLLNQRKDYFFTCNKEGCKDNDRQLSIKGKVPDKGQISIQSDGTIYGWIVYDDVTYSYADNQLIKGFAPINNTIYSWSNNYLKGTYADYSFELLNKLNISTIYHNFGDIASEDTIKIAHTLIDQGYEVYELTGTPEWYNSPETLKTIIDNYYNFNNQDEHYKIKGIVWDIEFYVDSQWAVNPNQVMNDMLETYREIISYASERGLETILCLPYWLDNNYLNELEELIKLSDGISIMNYNRGILLEGIENEINFAQKYNKPITNIAEFKKPAEGETEDNLTYPKADSVLADWQKMSEKYNYSKLQYAYHSLGSLLKTESGFETTTYIVQDKEGNRVSNTGIYVNIQHGGDIYHSYYESNRNGTFEVLTPVDKNIDIVAAYNMIDNIEKNKTNNGLDVVITLGEAKPRYTLEMYFRKYDKATNTYVPLTNQSVSLISLDTGYVTTKNTHASQFYAALNGRHEETYMIKINDGKEYDISINSIDSGQSTIYYPLGSSTYITLSVYIKEKE